jgi:2-phospho-L-lactate transferase/gluconeogenesis factor (CofD/UPF0052 family)
VLKSVTDEKRCVYRILKLIYRILLAINGRVMPASNRPVDVEAGLEQALILARSKKRSFVA